jgi:intracellular sulfur oxidation DsrE/DsrF family protein
MRYLYLSLIMTAFLNLAFADSQIDHILAADMAPDGVVFEILEDDDDALGWALQRVARLSSKLRHRFPGLSIAVVTHGREQFALLSDEAGGLLSSIHDNARQLRADDVDLHVCGIHAGWDGYTPEDFPEYVDVSASGPAQINDYLNLGYVLILLQREGY